jgi:hypothetical protein
MIIINYIIIVIINIIINYACNDVSIVKKKKKSHTLTSDALLFHLRLMTTFYYALNLFLSAKYPHHALNLFSHLNNCSTIVLPTVLLLDGRSSSI